MHENFLEEMFGDYAKVEKNKWLENVSSKSSTTKWIIKPELMRQYAWDILHLKDKKDRIADAPDHKFTKRWVTKLN